MKLLAANILPTDIAPLLKDGILDNTLELTDKGTRLLLTLAFDAYRSKLVAIAEKHIAAKTAAPATPSIDANF